MKHIRTYTNVIPQGVRFQLRRAFFKGANVTCVLCGNKVRQFHSHGGGASILDTRKVVGGMRREEDRCPVCHAVDRTRMLMLYLETETDIGKKPVSLLHVAPDFGLYLWLKRQQHLLYTGSDIDWSRYRHIPGIEYADLTKLPFGADSFDVIVCSHVLEHVPDDRAAFAEIYRVLKPGGHALLLTPFALDSKGTDEDPTISDPAERDRRFGQWDHVRIYDRTDFLERMREAGFQASLYNPFEAQPGRASNLHLNPLEVLPVGRKRSAE